MKPDRHWNVQLLSLGRLGLVGCCLLSVLVSSVSAESWDKILPAQSEVKKLAEGFKFTEGPAWHPDGFLLFTDIPNDRIVKYADGNISDFATPVGRCNGLMCDTTGTIYACQMGDGHVVKFDSRGKLSGVVADTYEGERFNGPNDLAIDAQGGMYFTDPYYGPDKTLPQPMMAVYYVSPSGTITRIIEDLERPNGVTISPNGQHLYVAEPNRAEVYRYRILRPGVVTAGTLIFKGDPELDGTSGPDGMTHDVYGNLYATYNGIVVLNPTGNVLGRIAVPEKPANCTFGGENNSTLYITARTGLYSVDLGVQGIKIPEHGPSAVAKVSQTGIISVKTVADTKAVEETSDVNLGGITLSIPKSWNSLPPSNRLRLAQFTIPAAEGDKAETELVVFPPFGGSIDDNISRWVKQFKDDGRKLAVKKGKCEQGTYYLADISGTYLKPDGPPFLRKTIDAPDHRMMAVILEVEGQGNYFLKLVGPQKSVDAAASGFRSSFGADSEKESDYELGN